MPRFYLDLRAHRDSHAAGETPWTPAIAVVYQVDEGLRLMGLEGAEHIFARHEACAAASRAGLEALGFELFADPAPRLEDGHRGARPGRTSTGRRSTARSSARGVVLAGGQGKLTGKIFRLGHLGSVTVEEILGAMSTPRVRVARRGPARSTGVGGRRRPGRRARSRTASPPRRPSGLVREGPRRRARRRGGHRAPARPPRGRRAAGPVPRRAVRDPARLRRARSSAARSRSTPS